MEQKKIPYSRIAIIAGYFVVALVVWLITRSCTPPGPGLPPGAVPCQGGSGTWNCAPDTSRVMQFSNVPAEVSAWMVPVKPEEEPQYRAATKEGFECLIVIAGNVAFTRGSQVVTKFDQPITLTLNYNQADIDRAANPDVSQCGRAYEPADFVPVILLSPGEEKSFWMPFPSRIIEGDTATIQFRTWGDPPIGWGSPKSQ